jgi:uncharacterized protein (TIGR04222 family)
VNVDALLHMHGPQFLAVYGVVATVVLLLLRAAHRRYERDMPHVHAEKMSDPYLIACLRGGASEAVRVVIASLLERKLLKASGSKIVAVRGAGRQVRRPLEHAVLEAYAEAADAWSHVNAPAFARAVGDYETVLRSRGLLADARCYARRLRLGAVALVLLEGLPWSRSTRRSTPGIGTSAFSRCSPSPSSSCSSR